jgi:hypothetical protein
MDGYKQPRRKQFSLSPVRALLITPSYATDYGGFDAWPMNIEFAGDDPASYF